MNFSILLASRERLPLLENLLESIQYTTHYPNNIEVLIGIDADDKETCRAQKYLEERFTFARFYRRHRTKNINRDYLNWMFNFSEGKYLIACNDDSEFQTKDWDLLILEKVEAYLEDKPDGIVYGYISDNLLERWGMSYCCFPLVSRKGVEALGYFLPPVFQGWNADVACWRVYDAVGRVCDLSGIVIDHISYHTGKRERDAISYYMEEISKEIKISGASYEIAEDVIKLCNAIGKAKRTVRL